MVGLDTIALNHHIKKKTNYKIGLSSPKPDTISSESYSYNQNGFITKSEVYDYHTCTNQGCIQSGFRICDFTYNAQGYLIDEKCDDSGVVGFDFDFPIWTGHSSREEFYENGVLKKVVIKILKEPSDTESVVTMIYDENGRLFLVDQDGSKEKYTYSPDGLLIEVLITGADGVLSKCLWNYQFY